MAGSLSEIKAKIISTEKTSKITSAMRMVSSAKLVKSEQAARDFQIYASKIRQITTDLLKSELTIGSDNPMLVSRPVKKTGYIVITSDKGLVGGYNSKILKSVMDMITEYHADGDYEIISIGSVGSDFFKARGMNVAFELRGLADQPSFEQVRQIISQSVDMFVNEIFDELYVCYNHHVNSLTSQVRVQQMFQFLTWLPMKQQKKVLLGLNWNLIVMIF
ncbi:F0F1 ATP synthase subunit gamma [Streptococcus pyogenes]|nr:F0F1 ATP synthase subunit gamma [Streptococcus pyogenes]